ncbi:uncharacterized protein LOC131893561 [Tigriopus californicus]|uniref:uncharacterized protein LOC131893561 n=1 Tax=Tigriopus californicus TaxID=6832 RepID=UPI0027DA220C|nr:uncharacterized protein LOC131893561 [Tigriopus californicus]
MASSGERSTYLPKTAATNQPQPFPVLFKGGNAPAGNSSATTNLSQLFTQRFLFLLVFDTLLQRQLVGALRCYTDIDATKGYSVECGLSTGCVKIYIDSEEMLMKQQRNYGYPPGFGQMPTLPPHLEGDPVLLRGCFVLAVPDKCYNAKNGLSYCWCSSRDLCNGSSRLWSGLRGGWPRWWCSSLLPLLLILVHRVLG